MNKGELVSSLADKTGLSKNVASDALNAVLDTIANALSRGEDVALPGFGTFTVRSRAARTGRNPQTGVEIQIAAANVPAFKPGKSLKEAVNQ